MNRNELCRMEKEGLIEIILCLQKDIEKLEDWNERLWLALMKEVSHEREGS